MGGVIAKENWIALDAVGEYFTYSEPVNIEELESTKVEPKQMNMVAPMDPNEKNIFTGLIRVSDNYVNLYKTHKAKEYIIEKMPSINILGIKYFPPMVEGKIDGYYTITSLAFTDGKPVLRLGAYTPLGSEWIPIYKVKMQPGEVISYHTMLGLYQA